MSGVTILAMAARYLAFCLPSDDFDATNVLEALLAELAVLILDTGSLLWTYLSPDEHRFQDTPSANYRLALPSILMEATPAECIKLRSLTPTPTTQLTMGRK